jgi:hypothetical protein
MVDLFGLLKGVNPATFGAYAILLALVAGFVFGYIVPGKTHDRVVAERDRYLEMATRGMELAKRAADVAGAPVPPKA